MDISENITSYGAENNTSISIPRELFNHLESIVATTYQNPVLFQVVPPHDKNRSEFEIEADSVVFGFTFVNMSFTNLASPIRITLQSIRALNNQVIVRLEGKTFLLL